MTQLIFIGTSDAFAAGGRRQTAILLRSPSGTVLLDCAPTTATGLVSLDIAREEIDAIAISHFHADHFAGLPQFLLASRIVDRRRKALVIAGPPGIEERVRWASAAVGHPLDLPLPFPLRYVEWHPGANADLGPVRIHTFATAHPPESRPHGLYVHTGRRKLVYSGDTGWFEALPEHVRGADLFICECTFYDTSLPHHLSYRVLRERAADFDCERLVLTHLGDEMSPRRGHLDLPTADDGDEVVI